MLSLQLDGLGQHSGGSDSVGVGGCVQGCERFAKMMKDVEEQTISTEFCTSSRALLPSPTKQQKQPTKTTTATTTPTKTTRRSYSLMAKVGGGGSGGSGCGVASRASFSSPTKGASAIFRRSLFLRRRCVSDVGGSTSCSTSNTSNCSSKISDGNNNRRCHRRNAAIGFSPHPQYVMRMNKQGEFTKWETTTTTKSKMTAPTTTTTTTNSVNGEDSTTSYLQLNIITADEAVEADENEQQHQHESEAADSVTKTTTTTEDLFAALNHVATFDADDLSFAADAKETISAVNTIIDIDDYDDEEEDENDGKEADKNDEEEEEEQEQDDDEDEDLDKEQHGNAYCIPRWVTTSSPVKRRNRHIINDMSRTTFFSHLELHIGGTGSLHSTDSSLGADLSSVEEDGSSCSDRWVNTRILGNGALGLLDHSISDDEEEGEEDRTIATEAVRPYLELNISAPRKAAALSASDCSCNTQSSEHKRSLNARSA